MSSPTSNAIRTPVKPRAKSPSDRKTARQGEFGTVWRRTAPVAMELIRTSFLCRGVYLAVSCMSIRFGPQDIGDG
jgi:hypothetical protein